MVWYFGVYCFFEIDVLDFVVVGFGESFEYEGVVDGENVVVGDCG